MTSQDGPGPARRSAGTALLTSVSSDAHTWNLVFLQLLLQEHGWTVVNLGACTPDDVVLAALADRPADLVVVSTVNGHGHVDGRRLVGALRALPRHRELPVVIGGKLGVAGTADDHHGAGLLDAGFDAVFLDADVAPFLTWLSEGPRRRGRPAAGVPDQQRNAALTPDRA